MRPEETSDRLFVWGRKQERAAVLVALDDLPDRAIADEVGIGKATLERWKLHPEFRERVAGHRTALLETVQSEGIAVVANRVRAQNERWKALKQIVRERGQDPRVQHVPGGTTGFIIPVAKLVKVYSNQAPGTAERPPEGDGYDLDPADEVEVEEGPEPPANEALYPVKRSEVVFEFVLDRASLQEMRALEEQAAKELGQHVHRTELTGKDGGPLQFAPDFSEFSPEELLQYEQLLLKSRRGVAGGPGADLPA